MSRLPADYENYIIQKEHRYLPGFQTIRRVDPSGKGYPVEELLIDNKTPFSLTILLFIIVAILFPGYLLSPAFACLLAPFTGTDAEGKPCGWLSLYGIDNGLQGIGKLKKYSIATNLIDPSKRLLIAYGGSLAFTAAGLLAHNLIVNQIGYLGIESFFNGSSRDNSEQSDSAGSQTDRVPDATSQENTRLEDPVSQTLNNQSQSSTVDSSESASFSGINLPITNTLCNKKRNFCLYNLARLVNNAKGDATYSFSEQINGETVEIRGRVYIENVEKRNGVRFFDLRFQDYQNSTTLGWSAAGRFELSQDANKPGIISKFITTESFGPKTPVGLENTAYLFPTN